MDFSDTTAFEAVAANLVASTNGGELISAQEAIDHMATQSRTVHLTLVTPEGTAYDYGIRTFVLDAPFTAAEVNNSTFTLAMPDVGTQTLQFLDGGSGSISFSAGDTNPITWNIDATGRIEFTEDEPDGTDSWDRILTRIEPTGSGEDVLVEISSPEGQDDFAYGAALGKLSSSGETINLAGVWDKTESYDTCPGVTADYSTDTITYNSGLYTSVEVFNEDIAGDCSIQSNSDPDETEYFNGTAEMTATELLTMLNDSEMQGIIINSADQFTITLTFGDPEVVVTQIWTRRP